MKSDDDFASLTLHVEKVSDTPYVGELLNSSDKPVRTVFSDNGTLRFEYIKPGEYYLRIFCDDNNNGRWDTGEYADDRQAEAVYYYPETIECKAKWPVEKSWDPTAIDATRQKPSAIVKQKPDKEKKIRNQNAERARKLGIQYIPRTY